MSGYAVKTIYASIQGEGFHTGRPSVVLRFAGCNLWTGREQDRARAICNFCDTDFVGIDGPGGGHYKTAPELAEAIARVWGSRPRLSGDAVPYVVCTGGEPLLQLDEELVEELHRRGFEVAVETNGTRRAPAGLDWICVSPKDGSDLVQTSGHELKLVYPQPDVDPADFSAMAFEHFYLQPMDGPELERNTERTIEYCRRHPRWRVSLQLHKYLGVA